MSSSEAGETILITRTNITYQVIDKELTGKVHHIRARDFSRACPAQDYITPIYLETASPAAKEYIARLAYIRLLTDYDWEPTKRILLFIGSNSGHISTYNRCPTCGLPIGIWCDERFNV